MSGVIRCSSADVRSIFEGWVASESAAGARLVVLEGAMMSGKSFLTGYLWRIRVKLSWWRLVRGADFWLVEPEFFRGKNSRQAKSVVLLIATPI